MRTRKPRRTRAQERLESRPRALLDARYWRTPSIFERPVLSKVAAATLGFWIMKIAATTVGETAGDTLSLTLNLGCMLGSALMAIALVALIACQIRARNFDPLLYWSTIVASTTAGTVFADFTARCLRVDHAIAAAVLLAALAGALGLWRWTTGTVSITAVRTPKVELFYWLAVALSQTFGAALGDWTAQTAGAGYLGGAALFVLALAGVAALYLWTAISRVMLFWAALVLTRPLGVALGDYLDKPLNSGGLDLSRPIATVALCLFILACVFVLPQRAAGPRPMALPS